MFRHSQDTPALPEEVTRRLESMMFDVPSSTAAYLGGLAIVPLALWWRSEDLMITAIAAFSVVLNIARVGTVVWFNSRFPNPLSSRPKQYWTILLGIGALYSLMMAALAVHALMLGEILCIAIAMVAVAGYITGVVIRASAVPQLAVPHLLLVFVPMIIASACSPDRGWLVLGFLLALFCAACIALSKTVYQRMRAQLLAEHQLSMLARTDYLTGLPNRASLDEQGGRRLQEARRSGAHLTLALIDLDGFKGVNDAHGHAAGDELLQQVSRRIRSTLIEADMAARLGGDEFAILFDCARDADEARAVGFEIIELLQQPFELAGATVKISGSVGMASSESEADSFASIVARADQAMYRAKNAARHQVPDPKLAAIVQAPSLAPLQALPVLV